MNEFYPETITSLPEADNPFKGVKGWLSQGPDHQIVFFEIEAIGEVAAHKHGAQWGRTYQKGDSYFVPDGVVHSAVFRQKTWLMDFFADKERYKAK